MPYLKTIKKGNKKTFGAITVEPSNVTFINYEYCDKIVVAVDHYDVLMSFELFK